MSNQPIRIRPGMSVDADRVAMLLGELGYPGNASFAREKLAVLCGPCDRILLAEKDGSVVGLISVHLVPMMHIAGLLAKVTALVVAAPYRNMGIGQALLHAAERFASDHGCTRMEVISGNHREGAHRFYRTHGYQATAQTRFIREQLDVSA